MAKLDPAILAHLEWIGFVRPTGLVVSAPALVRAGAILDRRDAEGQRALRACVEEREFDPKEGSVSHLPDFRAFAESVLDWSFSPKGYAGTAESPIPPELEVLLPDYGETLRPDFAVRELEPKDGASPWQLLVQVLGPGEDFGRVAHGHGKLEASARGRMERLLRQTGVPAGLLSNGRALRLVPDGTIYRALEKLLVLDGERISYRALDVEQIGSVYETMMGFRLETATGRSMAIKTQKKHGAPTTMDLEALLREPAAKRAKWLQDHAERDLTDKVKKAVAEATTVEDLRGPGRPTVCSAQSREDRLERRAHDRFGEGARRVVRARAAPFLAGLQHNGALRHEIGRCVLVEDRIKSRVQVFESGRLLDGLVHAIGELAVGAVLDPLLSLRGRLFE